MPRAAELAAALEAQRRFAAAAAHELRTPLAQQRALVEVALADPHADVAALREMGSRVVAACVEQEQLLEALLALSRGAHRPGRREPVDLAAVAAVVLEGLNVDGIASVVSLRPARTSGDPVLIERLVANLVSNAVRHNAPDGWFELVTRTVSGEAVLAVANTGPLVPAAELDRLFRPFQRLDEAARDGIGLGLSIVEAIADAHGASLSVRPRPEGGLDVEVAFPPVGGARATKRISSASSANVR